MGDSHGICGGFKGDSCRFWGIHANRLRQTPRNLWDSWGIQMRQLTPIIILKEGIRREHGKRGVVAVAWGTLSLEFEYRLVRCLRLRDVLRETGGWCWVRNGWKTNGKHHSDRTESDRSELLLPIRREPGKR